MLNSFQCIIPYALFSFVFGTVLFKKCAGTLSPRYPNVVSLVYYHYLLSQLIASFLIAIGLFDNWWIDRAADKDLSVLIAFYATFSSFLLLPLLIMAFEKLLHLKPRYEHLSLYRMKWSTLTGRKDKAVNIFLFASAIVLTLSLVLLFKVTKEIPLWHLLSEAGADELAVLRRSASTDIGWAIYLKNIIGQWFSPFITMVCFCYYLLTRKTRHLFLFIYMFMVTFLFLFYSLSKGPVLWFMIMLFICYSIYKEKINLLHLFGGFALILFFVFVMYITIVGKSDINLAMEAIVKRIFFSQYAGTVLSFDYFPALHDYIYGMSFIPLASHLELPNSTSYALLIMEYYNPGAWLQGKAGYLCSQHIAEGYANFGYIGIIIANIIVAFWVSLTHFFSLRVRYHPISIAMIVLLMVYIPSYMNTGVKLFIYNPVLIIIFAIVFLLIFLSRGRLVIKLRRE